MTHAHDDNSHRSLDLDGMPQPHWLVPDWPAPASVRALVTTRETGPSQAPFDAFNTAAHVGDNPAMVSRCRRWLSARIGDQRPLLWLNQVHGTQVQTSLPTAGEVPDADASVAFNRDYACVVLTADCLPVFFCDNAGTRVAVAHAGWRGLAEGVLERTVAALDCPAHDVMAWMGPAISSAQFEVGQDVFDRFVSAHPEDETAFEHSPYRLGHYMADLYQLAQLRLKRCGVKNVSGGLFCTASDKRFYSYRESDGVTGRMASVIWLRG